MTDFIAIAKALRRAASVLDHEADVTPQLNDYARRSVQSMRRDTQMLRDYAQDVCTHPDEHYWPAEQNEGTCAHCTLCNKSWPFPTERERIVIVVDDPLCTKCDHIRSHHSNSKYYSGCNVTTCLCHAFTIEDRGPLVAVDKLVDAEFVPARDDGTVEPTAESASSEDIPF